MYLKLILQIILLGFVLFKTNAQEVVTVDETLILLKQLEFDKAKKYVKSKELSKNIYNNLNNIIRIIETNETTLKIDTLDTFDSVPLNNLVRGYKELNNQHTRTDALNSFKICHDKTLSNELKKASLLGILKVFNTGITLNDSLAYYYLNNYKKLINSPIDLFWYYYYETELSSISSGYKTNLHNNDFLYRQNLNNINSMRTDLSNNKKVLFLIDKFNGDYYVKYNGVKAKAFYQKCLKSMDNSPYFIKYKFRLNLDISRAFAISGDYKKAIMQIHKSKKDTVYGNSIINKLNYNFFLSEYHEKLNNSDSSLFYYKKIFSLEKELNFIEHNKEVSKLEIELKTAEKEKQLLIVQQKKNQNKNIAYALGGLVFFSSITFLLIYKNTKRRQLLTEQDKELQTQKVATLLKEQELTAIDAMIEGQEKERQRIANDLHDDLGGLMTTLKWNFDALKEKPSSKLYNKTNELLEDAYNKVRSIAHTKNSGVIASKGLIKAIKDIADTTSASKKIQISVVDFGFDIRIENSLELTIFRIIQELITNIIKHAEATEATINITNHDDIINIMVEDNGKGFNIESISKHRGMGIHSIEKRIENLGGKVTIESKISSGTTVIIDIPI